VAETGLCGRWWGAAATLGGGLASTVAVAPRIELGFGLYGGIRC
jgi:hypothetical protein